MRLPLRWLKLSKFNTETCKTIATICPLKKYHVFMASLLPRILVPISLSMILTMMMFRPNSMFTMTELTKNISELIICFLSYLRRMKPSCAPFARMINPPKMGLTVKYNVFERVVVKNLSIFFRCSPVFLSLQEPTIISQVLMNTLANLLYGRKLKTNQKSQAVKNISIFCPKIRINFPPF